MNKSARQFIGLLAVNLVVGGLLALGCLYSSDWYYIFAALPFAVAAPALLVQPWFVGFWLLPYGHLLAPLMSTAVTMTIYVAFDRRGKMEWLKRKLVRLRHNRKVLTRLAVLVVLLVVEYARYIDVLPLHLGAPPMLQSSFRGLGLSGKEGRSYDLAAFHDLDDIWIWRAVLPEEMVNRIAAKLYMDRVPDYRMGRLLGKGPPYWWRPVISEGVWILSNQERRQGHTRLRAEATWNPENHLFHLSIEARF